MLWAVKEKAKPGRELTKRERTRNRRIGKVRAKIVWSVALANLARKKGTG